MKKHLIAAGIGVVIIVIIVLFSTKTSVNLGGAGGMQASACTTYTEARATVGDDISSTLLASNGRRAWARIQMPSVATNTVYVSFGGTASLTTGLILGAVNATTTDNYIDFGRNTDFPYTGAVTGLTNIGSTTVLVTECQY